ncbi:MAG: alcohol dehydrogenase catalytic domain-containing protein [Planctomycetes bacterium]|nr:alcohol dehydrogenase catalytic domain-containing protein [Planctomycetota bacterium]
MKAAFLTAPRRIEIRDVPDPPPPGPRDVLLAVAAVGVCGSDMHYYKAGRIGCQRVEYPWIVGHECAGVVLEVGAEVANVRPGDRVAVDPLVHCGRCDQCRIGHVHTCRRQVFLGCPGQMPGALCERLVMPASSVFAVPDGMSIGQAVLCEPFSIGLWARKLASPPAGAKVGILGSGPIGLCVLAACKLAGPCTVYQTDLLDERLELAGRLGADWTANAAREDVVEAVGRIEPAGLDVVFECAGEQETLDQCLQLVKPCCTVVIVGIPPGDRLSFDMNLMRRKEIRIQNCRRQLGQVTPAIEALASGKVDIDELVTHELAFEQAAEAFEMAADYRDGVVKAVIRLDGGA